MSHPSPSNDLQYTTVSQFTGQAVGAPLFLPSEDVLVVLSRNPDGSDGSGYQGSEVRVYDLLATAQNRVNFQSDAIPELPLRWFVQVPELTNVLYTTGKLICGGKDRIYQLDVEAGAVKGLLKGVGEWEELEFGRDIQPPILYTPSIGTFVIVVADDCTVYKVRALTHEIVAQYKWRESQIFFPPVLMGNLVVFLSEWVVVAINLDTMTEEWACEIRDTSHSKDGSVDLVRDVLGWMLEDLPARPPSSLTVCGDRVMMELNAGAEKPLDRLKRFIPKSPKGYLNSTDYDANEVARFPDDPDGLENICVETFTTFSVNKTGVGRVLFQTGPSNAAHGGFPAVQISCAKWDEKRPIAIDANTLVFQRNSGVSAWYATNPSVAMDKLIRDFHEAGEGMMQVFVPPGPHDPPVGPLGGGDDPNYQWVAVNLHERNALTEGLGVKQSWSRIGIDDSSCLIQFSEAGEPEILNDLSSIAAKFPTDLSWWTKGEGTLGYGLDKSTTLCKVTLNLVDGQVEQVIDPVLSTQDFTPTAVTSGKNGQVFLSGYLTIPHVDGFDTQQYWLVVSQT